MAKKAPKAKAPASSGAPVLRQLQDIYRFMQENALEAVELDQKDMRVRLVRQGRASVPVPVPVPMGGYAPAAAAAPAHAAPAAAPAAAALPANAVVVKSPMMGIFYRSSSPSSPPFAKEGAAVKPGDVLCLIEAMKVFNDVKAETAGVVIKVCVENGKSVKVGQDLFILERK